ncbi:hypothetical protein Tco_0943714 [Tanacetum coccineum]
MDYMPGQYGSSADQGKERLSVVKQKSLSPNEVRSLEDVIADYLEGSLEVRATSVRFLFIPSKVFLESRQFGHQNQEHRKANLDNGKKKLKVLVFCTGAINRTATMGSKTGVGLVQRPTGGMNGCGTL